MGQRGLLKPSYFKLYALGPVKRDGDMFFYIAYARVCSVHIGMCWGTHMCGGQALVLGVFLAHSALDSALDLLNPELASYCSLASQFTTGIPCLGLSHIRIMGSFHTCFTVTWMLGIEIRSLFWCSIFCIPRDISSVPEMSS